MVNQEVVESIEGQGRCKDTIAFILMDRVFKLTKRFKDTDANVNVIIKETGEDYYYSVV
ncbi:hypothetical protein [Paenibacillus illinoisensis]|nr:hypothetical protein [Paenibacillus illinoisensis]